MLNILWINYKKFKTNPYDKLMCLNIEDSLNYTGAHYNNNQNIYTNINEINYNCYFGMIYAIIKIQKLINFNNRLNAFLYYIYFKTYRFL